MICASRGDFYRFCGCIGWHCNIVEMRKKNVFLKARPLHRVHLGIKTEKKYNHSIISTIKKNTVLFTFLTPPLATCNRVAKGRAEVIFLRYHHIKCKTLSQICTD